jgi:hypothetical protein
MLLHSRNVVAFCVESRPNVHVPNPCAHCSSFNLHEPSFE